jgi:uncharacterized LabA/DUF88 family protein
LRSEGDVPARSVWVFIDGQNVYRDAREAFHDPRRDPASFGQVIPLDLAQLLSDLGPQPRRLRQVCIYTGAPSNRRQPDAYRAHMKQRAAWLAAGVRVFARTLQYPHDWPAQKAREKGVDVALAVDLIRFGLVERMFDVGIVASTDTDLVPALNALVEGPVARSSGWPRVEVMTWAPNQKRLRLPGRRIWCHNLDRQHYERVRDRTNYTI